MVETSGAGGVRNQRPTVVRATDEQSLGGDRLEYWEVTTL